MSGALCSGIYENSCSFSHPWKNPSLKDHDSSILQQIQLEVGGGRYDVRIPQAVDPASGPKYQKLFPGAKLKWVEDSSHFLQVDAPERTTQEIIDFDS